MKWYYWVLIALALIGVTLGAVYSYNQITDRSEVIATKDKHIAQMEASHAEELVKQKYEIEKNLYATIDSLAYINSKIKRDGNYWYTQSVDLKLQISDLESQGAAQASSGEDSLGAYYKTDFSGKVGILKYKGFTKYYISSEIPSFHYLFTSADPIEVLSSLYRDNAGLWKINTISKTPDVRLKTEYVIDSTFYAYISGAPSGTIGKVEYKEYNDIGLRFKMNFMLNPEEYSKISWRDIKGLFTAEFYYSYFNVTYHALDNRFSMGVVYDINLDKFWKNLWRAL